MTEDEVWNFLEIQQENRKKSLNMLTKIKSNEAQQYAIENLINRVNELEAQLYEAKINSRAQGFEEGYSQARSEK